MILVTGATGTIGREIVRRLPAGAAVRIMARRPECVTGASGRARIVYGDYEDPRSLERALNGVRAFFLLTNRLGQDDARLIDAARTAGVRHVVKLSAAAVTDRGADDLVTRAQRAQEELVRGSGMAWTLLRPRAFMSNTLSWRSSIRQHGVVRAVYPSAASSCVDPRDVAEVAVRALTEDGHAGMTYTLTGPEPMTAVQQTAQLAELLGRSLRCEELGPEQARVEMGRRHPEAVVEALLYRASRQCEAAKGQVGETVPALLGRPAGSFRNWAADHLGAFVSDPGTVDADTGSGAV
ncbi:NAD(P)H-binding protein [Streptomyces sp. NPDC001717]|uniref:NAD(P)H-binding protein n=1 Tax=Streptomyces sp. NPDC001717 TaxID=3364604 RepID=UPI0036BA87A6